MAGSKRQSPNKKTVENTIEGHGPLNHKSLASLQNSDARQVLDIVDELRNTGLGAMIELPQIVTCGDQSSGKSSVLEAITGIPFPRKENLCTRFATEIVLRRAKVETVSIQIRPDGDRPDAQRKELQKLDLSLEDFNNMEHLVEQSLAQMGLKDSNKASPRAFSRDVLHIEIAGPGRPHLTLVDLPGLIHSENKTQSKKDVEIIKDMVSKYMKQERTIVLAVVSAKNDYANQIVLKMARDNGAADRTLGIITKPDSLTPRSESEEKWMVLARNDDVFFGHGWHVLRNR